LYFKLNGSAPKAYQGRMGFLLVRPRRGYNNIMNESEYIKKLPKKKMATGVIFLNNKNQILVIKPTYKNWWSIPGGVINRNESPLAAGLREVKEEIGLKINSLQFLSLDYMSPKVSGYLTKDENIQFIFYGGKLSSQKIKLIKLDKNEISEYKFVEELKAVKILSDRLAKRLPSSLKALRKNCPIYLEGGKKV